ncbi:MAG: DUF4416 family protein [Thermodesulfobacteriota bacterium]
MSQPKEITKAKLISSLFSHEIQLIDLAIKEMEERFGQIDWMSEVLVFKRTRYYEREMGWPLYRKFISFIKLVTPESIGDIKVITNEIEQTHLDNNSRTINIDPGYVTLERLILATGKNYTHRVPLGKGIYADLTLIFHDGTFKPLSWTYPDYAEEKVIGLFNLIRGNYLEHLRKSK